MMTPARFAPLDPAVPPAYRGRRRIAGDGRDIATTAAAAALLALFWWLAVTASIQNSHTSDELPHITAGYAFDRFGDFRMQPENGVLPQRLFGLAPLAVSARFPMDEANWRRSTYWQIGWDFFYGLGNPLDFIVLLARSLNAVLGVVLGAFIFAVARRWHGRVGGLIALALFAFSPNFLAHSALATSDVAAALMLTITPFAFWWHLERRDIWSGVVSGLLTGITLGAKFNGLLLAPIFVFLILVDAAGRGRMGHRVRRLAANAALLLPQAAVAVAVIWVCFGLRFSARGPGTPELIQFAWRWDEMFAAMGWKRHVIEFALAWKVLPEAWLYGLTNVIAGEAARPAFFAGEHSLHGWWTYFPALVLTKTPLPMLAAIGAGTGVLAVRFFRAAPERRRHAALRAMPLLATAGIVWATAIASHLNIGDRHILAVYPLLFVLAGSLARYVVTAALAVVLIGAQVSASCSIRPHYLAFFNSMAGGSANAYRLFADSSLDWGQDLPGLHDWLVAHRGRGEKLYLGYFGSAWPPHYGVAPDFFLPASTYLARPRLRPYELQPGLYCVSATILSEVYSPYRGPWTIEQESSYRQLRARFAAGPANGHIDSSYAVYDGLRFARLCKFLQRRRPDADAGHSILIFRLSAEELHTALTGPVIASHRLRLP